MLSNLHGINDYLLGWLIQLLMEKCATKVYLVDIYRTFQSKRCIWANSATNHPALLSAHTSSIVTTRVVFLYRVLLGIASYTK